MLTLIIALTVVIPVYLVVAGATREGLGNEPHGYVGWPYDFIALLWPVTGPYLVGRAIVRRRNRRTIPRTEVRNANLRRRK